MVSLRLGRETGRRAGVFAKWRTVAREARWQARREHWQRKRMLHEKWCTMARGVGQQAHWECIAKVLRAEQQSKCVVCYSKRTPVVNEVQMRMMVRLNELNVFENTITYPYQTVCCEQAMHLA